MAVNATAVGSISYFSLGEATQFTLLENISEKLTITLTPGPLGYTEREVNS